MPAFVGRLYPTIFVALFVAATVANAYAWRSAWLGALLLAGFVLVFGRFVGTWAAPGERGALRTWIGAWLLLSAVMITGAACYYAAAFTRPAAVAVAIGAGPLAWWLSTRSLQRPLERPHDLISDAPHRPPARVWGAAALVVAGLLSVAWMLSRATTTEAVRTAWEHVPATVFFAFAVVLLILFGLCMRGRERALAITLSAAALLVFLGVALVVFPLGFGFDPFIHQATEEHIATYGSITPKPFYYIGQYALVLFAHHAFALPIGPVNAALVPVLAALAIPLAWYGAAAHLLRDRRVASATVPGLFLLPLASFVLTTPQGLANLWTLLLVLAAVPSLVRDERPRVWPLAIPALATLAIHPIAGLPALLFVILLASDPSRLGASLPSRLTFWSGVAVGSVILPLSFVANSLVSSGTLGLTLGNVNLLSLINPLSLFLANRFDPLLDFVYLYGLNAVALAVVFAVAGWWVSRRQLAGSLRVCALMAGMLAVNWALLSTAVDFSFLIDYERQNFAARLVPLALTFLAPFVIVALGAWMGRVRPGPVSLRVGTLALLAGLATASFYLAYPRNDAYVAGHGYNVSQTDLNAVRDIEANAAGASYAVLANQTVSAAAVRELGFVRYFGDQFFYPIPTGGDLYALFLAMNERPSRETAEAALALVSARCATDPSCTLSDATTLYYVVNDYWWEAPRIVETAKQNADAWWALDGGAVHVFRYDQSNP